MSSQMANRVDSRIYRPELAAVQFGHTKGTLFFDGQTGVWLVHSVPKFPPPDHYQYPDSGTDYGQTMLCMTFTYAQLKDIVLLNQLLVLLRVFVMKSHLMINNWKCFNNWINNWKISASGGNLTTT
ncbi:unnamed protein product, partial [Mesorhabditis belari]|uniref:Uncharacterized protein n=1 Tax=Mesorhabditis belari TaxID=2138241 RepID=A0AAF3FCM1_9BILA